jgi:hypothetical protein
MIVADGEHENYFGLYLALQEKDPDPNKEEKFHVQFVLRLNNQVTSKSISQNSTGEFNLRSGKVF